MFILASVNWVHIDNFWRQRNRKKNVLIKTTLKDMLRNVMKKINKKLDFNYSSRLGGKGILGLTFSIFDIMNLVLRKTSSQDTLNEQHNLGTFGMAKNVDQNLACRAGFWDGGYSLRPITDIFKNSNNHWVAREIAQHCIAYIPLSTTIYITALHFTPTQNYPRRNG